MSEKLLDRHTIGGTFVRVLSFHSFRFSCERHKTNAFYARRQLWETNGSRSYNKWKCKITQTEPKCSDCIKNPSWSHEISIYSGEMGSAAFHSLIWIEWSNIKLPYVFIISIAIQKYRWNCRHLEVKRMQWEQLKSKKFRERRPFIPVKPMNVAQFRRQNLHEAALKKENKSTYLLGSAKQKDFMDLKKKIDWYRLFDTMFSCKQNWNWDCVSFVARCVRLRCSS